MAATMSPSAQGWGDSHPTSRNSAMRVGTYSARVAVRPLRDEQRVGGIRRHLAAAALGCVATVQRDVEAEDEDRAGQDG